MNLFRHFNSTLLIVLLAVALSSAELHADEDPYSVITGTPNLVGFWDFSEEAGQARVSTGTAEQHALLEQNGPIPRAGEGPVSGYSALLNGSSQFFKILHENTGDLNISGPEAEVSIIAFIKQTQMSHTIAGMWSEGSGAGDMSGVRQYALLMDMPLYGGDDKVTPHISATGGASVREDGSNLPWCVDYAASQSTVAVNQWVSVGFTYDGTWVKAYYNGAFEAWNNTPSALRRTDSYFTQEGPDGAFRGINPYYQADGIYTFDPDDPTKQPEGAPFTVGARQAVGKDVAEPFKGYIGGLAVFNRALTEEEMMDIHAAVFGPPPPPGEVPVNVALNKPGTVDSLHPLADSGPALAVDGDSSANDASRWVSDDTPWPHWIELDLGATYELSRLKFWTGYGGRYRFPIDYQFQYWKDGEWTDIVTSSGNSSAIVDVSFDPVRADRVRLLGTGGGDNILRLYEIEVHGIPLDPIPATIMVTAGEASALQLTVDAQDAFRARLEESPDFESWTFRSDVRLSPGESHQETISMDQDSVRFFRLSIPSQ